MLADMERMPARGWVRGLGVAAGLGALLASPSAEATCLELDTYACEIIPTYGDCNSPETDLWSPGVPFTYRIGCEGRAAALRSPDLELVPGGTPLKARAEPLRQCGQWSLWVLEEPLPPPGPNGTVALRAIGAAKPLQMNLAIVAGAAKGPRMHRDPKRDFVCSVAPGIDRPPTIPAPPPAGCAACAVSPTAPAPQPLDIWPLISTVALAMLRAGRRTLRRRRA